MKSAISFHISSSSNCSGTPPDRTLHETDLTQTENISNCSIWDNEDSSAPDSHYFTSLPSFHALVPGLSVSHIFVPPSEKHMQVSYGSTDKLRPDESSFPVILCNQKVNREDLTNFNESIKLPQVSAVETNCLETIYNRKETREDISPGFSSACNLKTCQCVFCQRDNGLFTSYFQYDKKEQQYSEKTCCINEVTVSSNSNKRTYSSCTDYCKETNHETVKQGINVYKYPISSGINVMIKWHDGYFYPGRVLDQSIDGRWLVKFHDGDMRVLHENQLLALSVLPKGQTVFTLAKDGYADQGVIYSYLRDGSNVDYIIKQEDKTFQRFAKSLIILSQDQVDGLSFQEEPATSCVYDDTCATPNRGMIFEGLAFLLTCSSESNKTRKNRSGTSHLEISDPETSDEEVMLVLEEDSLANLPAFDKNRLVEQIEKSGGIWVNSFEEAQIVQLEQVFLIADTYLETYKYIQSIAAGIPCVSHVWVDNCCSTNSLLDYHSYLLPTGYSVIEKKLIEWHFQTSIFERCRVLLVFANDRSSITNWIVALLAAKSEVVQCLTELEDRSGIFHTDVIVTDSSCPDYVVKAAHQITIPLVSTEWIVQCIINGCIVPFESHPHFNFKYQDMSSEV